MKKIIYLLAITAIPFTSCKKEGCTDETATNYNDKAKKDDGSCQYDEVPAYNTPTTYVFNDGNGNSTVSFSGQTDRLNQLSEMVTYMKTGNSTAISASQMKDMFSNTNNPFTFTSTKQLEDKCFAPDVALFKAAMDDLEIASQDFAQTATNGQAGVLTSGTSTYLFDANGMEQVQFIEKGLMGAVFMNQALNSYFSEAKMNVDNTTAVDPSAGKYYTVMEHHWDEAFGYFGVDTDFPTTIPSSFWGKYCNVQDAVLSCNSIMMNNFLKGRAAITGNVLADRDAAISTIRNTWEEITANQTITYIDQAIGYFGTDQAKFLHVMSEAYAFSWNIRYAPLETRNMNLTEHDALMALYGTNLWDLTLQDLNSIKAAIQAKY